MKPQRSCTFGALHIFLFQNRVMQITDADGKTIMITDLNKALAQAKMFKSFRHDDKAFAELDKRLQFYWSDVYSKLLQLKKKSR